MARSFVLALAANCGLTALAPALACFVALIGAPGAAIADDKPPVPASTALAKPSVTEHTLELPARGAAAASTLKYTATAGYLPLLDGQGPDKLGKAKANVFSIAYVETGYGTGGNPARPVTFAFNGGPGSSSVWLHMGAIGPKRIVFGPDGQRPAPPYEVADNVLSWLPFTDVVFIDPVSTGYSRASEGEDPRQFHGLDEDARAIAEFIRLWLVRNNRWNSQKYLAGESYGTTRACQLAGELQGRHGIDLAGIVLISPILNFATARFDLDNDLPYPLFLPSYTAAAFHHKKLAAPYDQDLTKTLREVEAFALNEYTVALVKGDALTSDQRAAIASKLSAYTGLSTEYIQRADLRITQSAFCKELLRGQSKTIGRFDARYTGSDRRDVGEGPEFDPSYAAILGPFTASVNMHLRQTLKFESDTGYEILTGAVNPWNFGGGNQYPSVAERLRSAMSQNPRLRVLAACGYTDLATPYFAVTHTINHLSLDPAIRGNIQQTYYQAGHMMYLREADLVKLTDDVRSFYTGK